MANLDPRSLLRRERGNQDIKCPMTFWRIVRETQIRWQILLGIALSKASSRWKAALGATIVE